jgi:hypothetical protein
MSAAIESVSPESSTANTYERLRPLILWLGVGEVVWISTWLFTNGGNSSALSAGVVGWSVVMLGWMALVVRLSGRDFFLNGSRWLSNLVGFTAVVAVTAVIFGAVPSVRTGLFSAAAATTDTQLIAIHVLRVLAIGAAVKYWQGQLPPHFVLLGAVPDFLFALSAIPMLMLAGNGSLGASTLLIWHVVGASVFLGAGLSMFFSVPSPFRLFDSKPDASLVFRFPMVLAPNATVPLFVVAHLFAITKYAIGS